MIVRFMNSSVSVIVVLLFVSVCVLICLRIGLRYFCVSVVWMLSVVSVV